MTSASAVSCASTTPPAACAHDAPGLLDGRRPRRRPLLPMNESLMLGPRPPLLRGRVPPHPRRQVLGRSPGFLSRALEGYRWTSPLERSGRQAPHQRCRGVVPSRRTVRVTGAYLVEHRWEGQRPSPAAARLGGPAALHRTPTSQEKEWHTQPCTRASGNVRGSGRATSRGGRQPPECSARSRCGIWTDAPSPGRLRLPAPAVAHDSPAEPSARSQVVSLLEAVEHGEALVSLHARAA